MRTSRGIIIRARARDAQLKAAYGPAVDPAVELKRVSIQHANDEHFEKTLDTRESIRFALSGARAPMIIAEPRPLPRVRSNAGLGAIPVRSGDMGDILVRGHG
jgi:hypothetical protein